MKYQFSKDFMFSIEDVNKFSDLIGDNNPIHLDEIVAKEKGFKKQVVHGVLLAGLFSKHFGTNFPGFGAIYLSQTLYFKRPVYVGGYYKFEIVLLELNVKKGIGVFSTRIFSKENEICLDGEAKIKWKI